MATDNEFLRLIYLALANSSGGTGGAGMTASVKDGLDTSTDIEAIKTSLAALAAQSAINGWSAQLKSTSPSVSDNNDCAWTVPAGEEWWIQRVAVNFVASAVAGDRQLRIRTWSGQPDGYFNFPTTIAASNSAWFSASASGIFSSGISSFAIPIPPNLVVPPAGTFSYMCVSGSDAGDFFQTPTLFYRKRII